MRKVLIVSQIFPPILAGPPAILRNLFKYFLVNSYCVLTGNPEFIGMPIDYSTRLSAKTYLFRAVRQRPLTRIGCLIQYALIPWIVLKGLWIIFKERIGCIFGVLRNGDDLISAYIIHIITRLPLYVYLPDIWDGYRVRRPDIFMARLFEERILRAASKVYVMSEAMQDFYRRKYGLETVFLPHPVDMDEYQSAGRPLLDTSDHEIVFTGLICPAQADAIGNLVNALQFLPSNISVHLYTPESRTDLERQYSFLSRWGNERLKIDFADRRKVASVQMQASILFIGLSFLEKWRTLIETASPTKTPEYLAAGRPIIVHAPDYSYIANYAKRKQFALVVDRSDPKLLASVIMNLLDDRTLQENLIAKAKTSAIKHYACYISKQLQRDLLAIPTE